VLTAWKIVTLGIPGEALQGVAVRSLRGLHKRGLPAGENSHPRAGRKREGFVCTRGLFHLAAGQLPSASTQLYSTLTLVDCPGASSAITKTRHLMSCAQSFTRAGALRVNNSPCPTRPPCRIRLATFSTCSSSTLSTGKMRIRIERFGDFNVLKCRRLVSSRHVSGAIGSARDSIMSVAATRPSSSASSAVVIGPSTASGRTAPWGRPLGGKADQTNPIG
jgi:hypothetical protein